MLNATKKVRPSIYWRVKNLRPKLSYFDLSYEKKFDLDFGQLYPVMCDEVYPGDFFKIGCQSLIRATPLVAPVLHQIDFYVYYFFVSYHDLWPNVKEADGDFTDGWDGFITGDRSGDSAIALPRWTPVNHAIGSLWDSLGFPIGIDPTGFRPLDFPRRAYNRVWNEYFRDETIQDEVALTNESLLNRNWPKDYYTSALLTQQRGTAPSFPVTGSVAWAAGTIQGLTGLDDTVNVQNNAASPQFKVSSAQGRTNLLNALNANTLSATTFDIADLRLALNIQEWMERNARAGNRYIESLWSHFNIAPQDERLERPEYIGGAKIPVQISEVLQTSESAGTPQGTLAGHGLGTGGAYCGKYKVKEHGLIIGLASIMPVPSYVSQGINKQWTRNTRYDFYWPEFADLSEQEVYRGELYATAVDAENNTLFGYQGRYDELRFKPNMITGTLRTTLDEWHLGRIFAAAPVLNSTFITCDSQTGGAANPLKRIFAVPASKGFIVSFANLLSAWRPLPFIAQPSI